MLTSVQRQKICDKLIQALPDLQAIYLFGSHAQGTTHKDSDTDLAILIQTRVDPSLAFTIKSELSLVVSSDVDLVDLWRADTVTQAQVIAYGERLYVNKTSVVDLFETTVFSQYALLNEERRDILTDIVQRGSIRG